MKDMKKNSLILLVVTILIMVLILKDDFSSIVEIIANMKIGWLIVAVLVMSLYWLFKSLGMFYIVKEYSPKIRFKTIFQQTMITQFFNGVTPFSTGGQPMEIYMLKKCKINFAKSTNIVLQNFIVYQIALVLYGIFALILNYKYKFFNSINVLRKLVFLGFSINTIVCIGVIFVCFSPKFSRTIMNLTIKLGMKFKFIKKYDQLIESWTKKLNDFHDSAKLFIKKKGLFIKGLIYNILALTCYYSVAFFLLLGMSNNVSISLIESLVASAYVLIIGSFVPIPGGTGGIEYGFVKFFGNFFGGALLSAMLIIWRFVTYYLGMILGGITFSFYKGDE